MTRISIKARRIVASRHVLKPPFFLMARTLLFFDFFKELFGFPFVFASLPVRRYSNTMYMLSYMFSCFHISSVCCIKVRFTVENLKFYSIPKDRHRCFLLQLRKKSKNMQWLRQVLSVATSCQDMANFKH